MKLKSIFAGSLIICALCLLILGTQLGQEGWLQSLWIKLQEWNGFEGAANARWSAGLYTLSALLFLGALILFLPSKKFGGPWFWTIFAIYLAVSLFLSVATIIKFQF